MSLKRRDFLKVSLTSGGALALGFALPGCSTVDTGYEKANETWTANAWLEIDSSNQVTFILDRVEMGQGTYTGLTTLIGEELDLDPSTILVRFAPVNSVYNNPAYQLQVTGGSTSMRTSWKTMREAGAGARSLLLQAAARVWQVDAADCSTRDGYVLDPQHKRKLSYGQLAALAAQESLPDSIPLKPSDQWRFIGKWQPRLDAQAKVTGRAQYGIDTELPGLTYATLLRPPMVGGKVGQIDDQAARAMPGVIDIFATERGVAVVAERYWQALSARKALKVDWDTSEAVTKSDQDVMAEYHQVAKDSRGDDIRSDGDADAALEQADQVLAVDFEVPFLAHATMEPMNATARITEQGLEVWAPTQAPDLGRIAAARVTDYAPDQVTVHTTFIGGGFGRRLTQDYIGEVAEIAAKAKRPVKLIWTREDDVRHDNYRPAMLHRLRAGISQGRLVAWDQQIVGPDLLDRYVKNAAPAQYPWAPKFMYNMLGSVGLMAEGVLTPVDTSAYEGADEYPYAVENVTIRHNSHDAGIPVSYWRSVGHSHTAFAIESFMDEVAHSLGQDPYSFRMSLLKDDPRRAQVLRLAVERANWGQPLPAGRARGLALHRSFGTTVAEVVEASVELGEIRIHKVTCAVDCGRAVNPDVVRMQMESGIIFGLTAALYGRIDFRDGQVQQSNFHDYQLLRLDQTPEIDIILVPSDEDPSGVGEPGVPPSMPALGNALFALTGQRQRSMPFRVG